MPILNLKPELREGETVLEEYGATVYRVRGHWSSAGSNVRLWLTNQRLILKAGFGPQRTLPLYAVVDVREEKIAWYTMVRLEFANGHLERLTVQNQAQFLNALRTAQAKAPEIPEAVSPAIPIAPEIPTLFGAWALGIALMVSAFVCLCLSFVILRLLWLVLLTH